jgi:hypothetical protein
MKAKKIGIFSAGTQFNVDHNAGQAIISRRERGLSIDYFFYVRKSGYVVPTRPLEQANGSIDLCWEGGLNDNGDVEDTRTEQQRESLNRLTTELKQLFPEIAKVVNTDLKLIENI